MDADTVAVSGKDGPIPGGVVWAKGPSRYDLVVGPETTPYRWALPLLVSDIGSGYVGSYSTSRKCT